MEEFGALWVHIQYWVAHNAEYFAHEKKIQKGFEQVLLLGAPQAQFSGHSNRQTGKREDRGHSGGDWSGISWSHLHDFYQKLHGVPTEQVEKELWIASRSFCGFWFCQAQYWANVNFAITFFYNCTKLSNSKWKGNEKFHFRIERKTNVSLLNLWIKFRNVVLFTNTSHLVVYFTFSCLLYI